MKKYQIKPGMFCRDDSGRVYLFLNPHQGVDIMSGEYLFTSEYDVDMQPTVGWARPITGWAERGSLKDTGESLQLNINWIVPQEKPRRIRGWSSMQQ